MVSWIIANPFLSAALACAAGAGLIVLWFLLRRPALDRTTKLILLAGIGLLPLAAAMTGNVAGFEATKARRFCGSCHVMTPYRNDSEDRQSMTLAARHGRNDLFGDDNCYACHADYGMFGTVVTKMGGLRHVYEYIFHYRNTPLDEARRTIHIRKPFQNATCMHCHSTQGSSWNAIKEHASLLDRVRDGTVSCASAGCHGPAHPFSKPPAPQTPPHATPPPAIPDIELASPKPKPSTTPSTKRPVTPETTP